MNLQNLNLEACTVKECGTTKTILQDPEGNIITLYPDSTIDVLEATQDGTSRPIIAHMYKNTYRIYADSNGYSYYDITVYPNQKIVQTIKCLPKSYIMGVRANKRAMQELSCHAFVLYQHFVRNVSGFVEALSYQSIAKTSALTERKYRDAIDELTEKGYLAAVPDCGKIELYRFYENPSTKYLPQK